MKINDRGHLVWDEAEYVRGLIEASELDRETETEYVRERPRNLADEARLEGIREMEMDREAARQDAMGHDFDDHASRR